jgi:hypothetical protein
MTLTDVGDPFWHIDNPCVSNMNHVFSVAPLLESCSCLSDVAHIASRTEAVTYPGYTFGGRGVLK